MNEIDNGFIASWDAPSISGRIARLLGESVSTCSECCNRTASLQDVSDIDEKHLSSKDEAPESLSFADRCRSGHFGYFQYPRYCNILVVQWVYLTKIIYPQCTFHRAFHMFRQSRCILTLTLSRHECISASYQLLQWILGTDAASSV